MRETFVSRAIRVGVVSNGCCTRLRYRDPQRAIASCDEWQAVFIAWPVGVVRQLEFLSTASQHLPSCACFLISAEASCINVRIFWASIAHAVQSSVDVPGAWRTPVVAVGTDPKMILNSARMSDAGLLTGALMPPPAIGARVGNPAKAGDILANTVVGTLLADAVLSSPGQMAQSGVFPRFERTLPRICRAKISTRCSIRNSPPRPRPMR